MKPSTEFTPFRDNIINSFPKIIFLGIFLLFVHFLPAQNIDYNSRITGFYGSNCGDDGVLGGPEEHTWHGWIRDNVNLAETYSGCRTADVNGATTLGGSFAVRNRLNVSATSIRYRIDAYEDDGGNRCTFDSGDDCRVTNVCTFSLTNNINEYAYNSRTYTCGTTDYRLTAFYQYRYSTTSLANATEYSTTTYITSGARPFWGSRGNWAYFGSDCATSGTITHNQNSSFSTSVSCKSEVQFWWGVSSEANYDFLEVYVNNTKRDSISGNVAWAFKTIDLDTGVNVVEWRYVKNGSVSAGSDRAFVDQISFVDATSLNPGTITGNQIICSGDDPVLLASTYTPQVFSNTPIYQWQVSTNSGLSWTNIPLSNVLSYDPPIGLSTTSQYRRSTLDGCGNTGYSNLVMITVNDSSVSNDTVDVCNSYAWQGMTLTASGMYYDTIPNAMGCDSLMSLSLTIRNQSSAAFTATDCDSYAWGGMTLTASGMYYDTIPNAMGCDSLMSLSLTIRNQSSAAFTATACDSYAWQGMTLTASGMYYDTIPNAMGCDSLMSLSLTIRNQSSAAFTATACDSYAWQGMTLTASGMYYDTIPNAMGCDSLMSLNLTIDQTTNSNLIVIACQNYTWQHNNTLYSSSGIYTDTTVNGAGCDSILVLSLTIDTINLSITNTGDSLYANQLNANSYQWLDCNNNFATIPGATSKGFKPSQSGSYAVTVINGTCQGSSVCQSVLITGIEKKSSEKDFVIYPNPTRNEFTLSTTDKGYSQYIQIYDIGGSLLKEVQLNAKDTKVNVSNFAVGVYFIRFENNFKKLIISN